jgi:hypothetical protein
MKRATFLTIAAMIALAVGTFALTFPALLLESKGVIPNLATQLWTRETGMLLMALGGINWSMRNKDDSSTLTWLLWVNICVQAGLFVMEAFGYADGVISKLSGVAPNLSLHMLLTSGFIYFLLKLPKRG